MSGGFFRGTSADQDTRFSNKHAKLLKSQKFASELNHLVDMTKVKMDVMRPWIANRVTELLGFEDEVLINFIYGLLDEKVVNGKEVQITLTGFMEKNTGKFMKELWTHLLSAQNNASGVPQQFLDAKEEETRKKMAETDRIANEIQKKKEKEGRELEQEKLRKMDVKVDISRANNADLEPSSKHQLRASSAHPMGEKETSERNGSRARSRVSRSPLSVDRSSLSPRDARSRSVSKSFSNSRSYSDERRKSRSISESPQPRQSHRKYSPRQSLSPSRHRLSHSRRRSTSRSRRRSPSPVRHRLRSPLRRRLWSPMRHIPRSPVRRSSRSLLRYRSRSPIRRRSPSPVRQRSPSPVWLRSPSPLQRRSPSPPRRRSPFLVRRRYRRSPSTPRCGSPSPVQRRSPIPSRRRSPTNSRHRYPSPEALSSLSPVRHLSPSPGRRKSPKCQRRSPVQCQRERIRTLEKFSPVRHAPHRENVEHSAGIRKGPDSVVHRPPISLRSPQRDPRDKDDTCKKAPASLPSPYRSPSHSESPPSSRRRNPSEDRRSYSPYKSPVKQTKERKIPDISASRPWKPRDQKPRHDYPETSGEEEDTNYARDNVDQKLKSAEKRSAYSSKADDHKDSLEILHCMDDYSPERVGGAQSSKIRSRPDGLELRKKDQEIRSEKTSRRVLHPEVSDQQQLTTVHKVSLLSESQQVSYPEEAYKTDEKNRSRSNEVKAGKRRHEAETALKSTRKVDENDRSGSLSSGSQENDRHHPGVHEKRKHKRSGRQEVASDDSYNSELEERKEAKRRRKGEKRLRKEERRRRREERCRRREQRRAEKLKGKSISSVTPLSDYEKNQEDYASDDKHIVRMESGASGDEETVSEPKKLEIELRKKALESLRAKKGVGH